MKTFLRFTQPNSRGVLALIPIQSMLALRKTATSTILLTAVIGTQLTACGSIGNVSAVKDGLQYAVDCQPDKALEQLDMAEADGGLSGYMGKLERIVVLQDAGRFKQAEIALDSYMALPEVEGETRAEVEKSIKDSLEELLKQREKQTGKRTCE